MTSDIPLDRHKTHSNTLYDSNTNLCHQPNDFKLQHFNEYDYMPERTPTVEKRPFNTAGIHMRLIH